jgi:hypothetical protein
MRQPLSPYDFLAALRAAGAPDSEPDAPVAGPVAVDQIVDGLLDIILTADEVFGYLHEEEGSPFLWIEPHLDRLCREADAVLQRIAN